MDLPLNQGTQVGQIFNFFFSLFFGVSVKILTL